MLLIAPSDADALPIQTTADVAPVLVFSIVRLLSDPPLFDPSIVTKSAPFKRIIAEAEEPAIVVVCPLAGRMVSVFVALAELLALIVIGKVSLVEYVASVKLKTTGPHKHVELYSATAAVRVA